MLIDRSAWGYVHTVYYLLCVHELMYFERILISPNVGLSRPVLLMNCISGFVASSAVSAIADWGATATGNQKI